MTENYYPNSSFNYYLLEILAGILILPAIILISHGNYLGLILIGIWLSFFTSRKGVQINYQRKQFSLFAEFLWQRVYQRKNLKNYSGYRMRRMYDSHVYRSKIQSTEITKEIHVLELFNSRTKKFEIIAKGDLNEIKDISKKISEHLGIPTYQKLK
jgi:hypothetical protein